MHIHFSKTRLPSNNYVKKRDTLKPVFEGVGVGEVESKSICFLVFIVGPGYRDEMLSVTMSPLSRRVDTDQLTFYYVT